MNVTEINDKAFRKIIYSSVQRKDNPRRFEIHFTDLPSSLIISLYRKYFPGTYNESSYGRLSTWMRGKGHEIGVVNMLKGIKEASVITQKITKCGFATGSIDLILNDIIYEITTTVFAMSKGTIYPWIGKTKQLMYYIASEDSPFGRLKIFFEVPNRGGRYSRTWQVSLNKEQRSLLREAIKMRSVYLHDALESGDWTILPRTKLSWCKKDEEDIVKFFKKNPLEVRNAYNDWLLERKVHFEAAKKFNHLFCPKCGEQKVSTKKFEVCGMCGTVFKVLNV